MNVHKKSLVVLIIVALLCPTAVLAKGSSSDWGKVQRLKRASKIIVQTKHGLEYTGELRSVTADSLFLTTFAGVGGQLIEVRRDDIQEIRTKRFSSIAANALGLAIGISAGAAVGGIIDARSQSREDPHLTTLLFGFLGSLGGLPIGRGLSKTTKTIYVAP